MPKTLAGPSKESRTAPHVDSWLLVQAAARLSEGIEAEHAMLTATLDRAHRRASSRRR